MEGSKSGKSLVYFTKLVLLSIALSHTTSVFYRILVVLQFRRQEQVTTFQERIDVLSPEIDSSLCLDC